LEHIFDPEDIQVKTLGRAFDAYNRLESLIQPHGTTIYSYDNNSNLTVVTDAKGNTTSYIYDSLNRLKEIIEPSPDGNSTSPATSYEYDIQDHLIRVTDANGHITQYDYDDFGNLLKTISSDTGTTTAIYDKAGNIISRTDAKNNTTTYTYDALNRLTEINFQDSTQDITYTYDQGTYGKGRLTGMTNPGGVYTYTYDIFGNLIQENKIIEGHDYSTCYTYDEAYHLTSITYPDGLMVSYDLDETGKIREISITKGVLSRILASNIQYLPFGPLTGLTYGNGNEMTKIFDQAYRLNSIHTGSIQNLSYTLDGANSITSITDNLDPLHSQSFSYDSLYRLTSAEGVYGIIDYSYDLVGNRLSKHRDAETDIYSYDTGTNRLLEITGSNPMAFSYDENGNTVSMGNKGFAFNQNNRMMQASVDGAPAAGYTYNGFDHRIKKTAGDITTIYHYDQSGNLISESNESGENVIDHVYIGNTRIAAVLSPTGECQGDLDNDGDVDGSDLAIFAADFGRTDCDTEPPCEGDFDHDNDVDGSDLAIFADDFGRTDCPGEDIYYYHNDHLGTPQKMTDMNGAVVWSADYRPFGQADVTVNTVVNNFRFPGQYYDQGTGLHYNWHRYYDPGIGRYLRADPIGLIAGVNLFRYCANRPLNLIDPQGLKEICIPWLASKTKWEEVLATEEWRCTGTQVLLVGVSGACYWTKYRLGEKKREITNRKLCWDSCRPRKIYIKKESTVIERERFEVIIDTDMTPIRWVLPVGGFGWSYQCDRNYRSPFITQKR
jgi:RHS repeat-associated protein